MIVSNEDVTGAIALNGQSTPTMAPPGAALGFNGEHPQGTMGDRDSVLYTNRLTLASIR